MATTTPAILDPSTLPPLITTRTAAELTDISEATIRRMIARGEIRARRIGPRLLRIETASLFDAAAPIVGAK